MAWTRGRYGALAHAKVTATPINAVGGGGGGLRFPTASVQRARRRHATARRRDRALEAGAGKGPGYRQSRHDVSGWKAGGRGIVLDRERAADLGVPVASVGRVLRALVADDAVSELKQGVDAFDIVVQLPKSSATRSTSCPTCKSRKSVSGALVDLASVVRVERGEGPAQIERQARQRQITVLAGLQVSLSARPRTDSTRRPKASSRRRSQRTTPAWRTSWVSR